MNVLVLNGPNLNLLGKRESAIYGDDSLDALKDRLAKSFPKVSFSFYQSNHEGELIDRLHAAAQDDTDAILFNPGGYTHTSVALRDAVAAIDTPVIEVHISNVAAREPFRQISMIAPACVGQIGGLGLDSYVVATHAMELRLAK